MSKFQLDQTDSAQAFDLLAAIVDSSDDAIVSKSLDGIITSWNQGAEKIFGYTAQEAIGKPILMIVPPDRRHEEAEILQHLRRGERIDHFQTVRVRKDETLLDISVTISPIRDASGQIVGASKVARDITLHKKIAAEAAEANAKFRAIFDQTTLFAGVMTVDGILTEANHLSLDACGYKLEDVVGHVFWETGWWAGDKQVQAKIRAATMQAAGGNAYREELPYWWADGTQRIVDFAIHPVRDAQGKIIYLHPTGTDITERKLTEERLRILTENLEAQVGIRTEELERRNAQVVKQWDLLRELSARLMRMQDEERRHIARELHDSAGQTLAVLAMSLARLSQEARQHAPRLAKDVDESEELVQQLIREIRTTSYLLHPPLLDEAGLAAAVQTYVQGLGERGGLDISVEISGTFGRLPNDLELVIFRVIQECLTNIIRHSGSKAASIRIVREKGQVELEVEDFGKGVPPDKLDLFQSDGSGVGIRGMRERVRHFRGEMKIVSHPGSGTKVCVTFPVAAESKAPAA